MIEPEQDLDRYPVAESTDLVEQVPVIDIGAVREDAGSTAARDAVDRIAAACREWGFFQIVNHGMDQASIDEVWRQAAAFFRQPPAIKEAIMRTRRHPWGYYNNELTKNQRDKKEVFDYTTDGIDPIYGSENRWPDMDPSFRTTLSAYFEAITRLGRTLLEALCVGLDLPADTLHRAFGPDHTGFIRLNYYPVADPLEASNVEHLAIADLGLHHHSDAGGLTVLLQDQVGGLQVFQDGYWHDVTPVPGAFVINTGDMMQVWSNDIYRAPVHRVLAMSSTDRYSVPFFFNPAAHTEVSPLPSVVTPERAARYRPIHWGEFRGKRSEGDYADYGPEVQITQYRIR